jgi:hypothetical protein
LTWKQTYTGRVFDLLSPTPDSVCIEDIAHSLSMLCRFNGHCRLFYSVAEHSVHVWRRVRELGGTRFVQQQALLHDAAEAYTGDMASPMKLAMRALWRSTPSDFDEVEARARSAVAVAFGLPERFHSLVKVADLGDAADLTSGKMQVLCQWSHSGGKLDNRKKFEELGLVAGESLTQKGKDLLAMFPQEFRT